MSARAMMFGTLSLVTTLAGVQAAAQVWDGHEFNITAGSFFHTSDTTIRIDGE